jgi:glycosyltransferase involved in cell wall biosynthesis
MRPFILIQGPVATRSGYGNHTRDLVTALIKADKYDIQIISLPWGQTPMDALKPDNLEHNEIFKRLVRGAINKQPDVFIQISVPNEFGMFPGAKQPQKIGKYNIGITAGIETTAVSHEFLQGANRMDMLITTSEHSKDGFIKSVYDKIDEQTKQKTGTLKLETPIEVLFEGVDLNTYKKIDTIQDTVSTELKDIKDSFCYLFTGHWLKGNIGQDRKDVGMMIKTFCEAFKRKSAHNRPGLILKTSHANFSIMDRDAMMEKIQQVIQPYGNNIPNIYLLHGDLTDEEMNSLYNHPKVKAMVSFTKGEGFGRPLAEFAMTGKPIIASNWSGQIDFLHKDYCTLLPGQLTPIHKSAADAFLINGSNWFTVDYAYASKILQDVMDNYKHYLKRSRKMPQYMKENFSREKMNELFVKLVDKGLEGVPQQVGLKLPKLKKATTNETPKVKLPKLKKVEA